MARRASVDRYWTIWSNGSEGYGRRDPKTGRWKRAGNDIDYVYKKLEGAANLCGSMLFRELQKMSKAFFNSYASGTGGDMLPKDTGNLIDSTSILVARGESYRGEPIHVTQAIATRPQHWHDKSGGKAKGFGVNYRINDIDSIMDIGVGSVREDVAVALTVGIPYAVPLNENDFHGLHTGFFDDMAADFKDNVMELSKEVALALDRQGDDEALIYGGLERVL